MKTKILLLLLLPLVLPTLSTGEEVGGVPEQVISVPIPEFTPYVPFEPSGDYSKLKSVLRTNKLEYQEGEPVFVRLSWRNDSDENIHIYNYGPFQGTLNWKIRDSASQKTPRTQTGEANFPEEGWCPRHGSLEPREILAAGREISAHSSAFMLNEYFDLSRLGAYYISSLHRDFMPGPGNELLESNSVSFRIKSGPPFRSSGLLDSGWWHYGAAVKPNECFDDLPPSGDYSKLQYVLRINKAKYKEAEPVFLRLFLQNESEDTINVCVGSDPCWMTQNWSLIKRRDRDREIETLESQAQLHIGIAKEKNPDHAASLTQFFADRINRLKQINPEVPAPKLRLGQLRFPDVPRDAAEVDWVFEKPSFVKLGPGEEVEMEPGETQLNLYYDVSTPGKYVLKCQRSTVIPDQKFDSPLESNEIEFEIVGGSHFSPSDLVDPGRFDNTEEQIGESSENYDAL